MKAQVFIAKSDGGLVEVSVTKDGLSSGAAHKYETVEKAANVLLAFGFDPELVDRQLSSLAETPPNVLIKLPVVEITDDVLSAHDFTAAAFRAA
jgi:hypothetical protein